ncbi:hypothetical protein [Deinococcus marmoris]|uniref:hypothetical protein n=1 Tax=Deinococcus marmoris TaxID=249408 RepID=UPI001FE044B5|nr:hypothetical protein [Deinococcus marmoris]
MRAGTIFSETHHPGEEVKQSAILAVRPQSAGGIPESGMFKSGILEGAPHDVLGLLWGQMEIDRLAGFHRVEVVREQQRPPEQII